jgi:hypothetical protein
MTEFTPQAFEVAITEQGLNSSIALMELNGKSYAQICKDGIDRAAQSHTPDQPIEAPQEWLVANRAYAHTLMRLPTDTLQNLDMLATNSGISWGIMASFLTECEVYQELMDLNYY